VHQLFEYLRPLIRAIIRWPWALLLIALAVTAVTGREAMKLSVDSDFANLLPQRYTSVQALMDLRERVGAESPVDVAIESPSFEANRRFAEALIPRVLALEQAETGKPYFTRVDYRRELGVLVRHAPYFATYEELDRLEREIHRGANYVRALADPLPAGQRARQIRLQPREGMAAAEGDVNDVLEELGLREYPVNADSTILALRFYPTGSQTDLRFIDSLYSDLDSLVAVMEPTRFDPRIRVTTAGRLLRQSVEIHAITDDVSRSFGSGIALVLLSVVSYFIYKITQAKSGGRFRPLILFTTILRAPVLAVVIGLPMVMSLVWSFAIAALAFGNLNLMTATLGLVLFGMGIDFGIHFFARYAEERGRGKSVEEAAETTFIVSGPAISATAVTTSLALFILVIADFKGFSEFGWIGGTGVILALVSMLTVMPAFLVLAERLRLLDLTAPAEAAEKKPLTGRFPFARTVVVVSFAIVAGALFFARHASFEYDFNRLSPAFPEFDARQARVDPVYNSSRRNPAYLLLDNARDVPGVVSALRRLARQDSLILAVESLQERIPTDSAEAQRKIARLAQLRALLDDPFLLVDTTGTVDRLRSLLSITLPLPLDSVPDFITRPFTDKTGHIGNFVIVYPSRSLGDARESLHFARLVGEVTTGRGQTFYAGSTSLVAADTLRLMQREAPRMIWIAAILVLLITYFEFRSPRWTVLALIPLVVGMLWMLGGMELLGLKLTFYNLVVLPTVLGAGEDGGVHIIHRYRELGPGSILQVLRSTGEHVLMCAITTLQGFAGLMFSFHPGLQSIGTLAVLGLGSTLITAIVFLPALIQVIEDLQTARKNRPPRRVLPSLRALFPDRFRRTKV